MVLISREREAWLDEAMALPARTVAGPARSACCHLTASGALALELSLSGLVSIRVDPSLTYFGARSATIFSNPGSPRNESQNGISFSQP